MKDAKDKKTGDLLASSNSRRQAAYAERQRHWKPEEVFILDAPGRSRAGGRIFGAAAAAGSRA